MSKTILLVLSISSVGLSFVRIQGQNLPAAKTVQMSAAVTVLDDLFVYDYRVANSVGSTTPVWNIGLDISAPLGSMVLSDAGLHNGQGFLSNSANTVLTRPGFTKSIPVGAQAPKGWAFSPSVSGSMEWAAVSDSSLLQPGQSLQGFELTSPGLPSIRTFTARPHVDLESLNLTPPEDPSDLDRYESDLANAESQLSFQGQTIAPTAPPVNFVPLEFLRTIQTYKEQSLRQGWISDVGVANSLDAKLNAAQQALQAGDDGTAKNVLNALLNEIRAQADKHMTPEAVALLQFNVQYLISRLL